MDYEENEARVGKNYGYGGESEVIKTGEVSQEIDSLEQNTAQLEKEVNMLLDRLNPLLENIPIPSGVDGSKSPSRNTAIGNRLANHNDSIRRSITQIRDIRNRAGI